MNAVHKCCECGKQAPLYSMAVGPASKSFCIDCFNVQAPKMGLPKIKEVK